MQQALIINNDKDEIELTLPRGVISSFIRDIKASTDEKIRSLKINDFTDFLNSTHATTSPKELAIIITIFYLAAFSETYVDDGLRIKKANEFFLLTKGLTEKLRVVSPNYAEGFAKELQKRINFILNSKSKALTNYLNNPFLDDPFNKLIRL